MILIPVIPMMLMHLEIASVHMDVPILAQEILVMHVNFVGIQIAIFLLLVIMMKILLDQVNVHGVVLISMQEIIMLVVINAGM